MNKIFDNGYKCPFCGYPATHVVTTSNISSCVIRIRHCAFCDRTHETVETATEMAGLIRDAISIKEKEFINNNNTK